MNRLIKLGLAAALVLGTGTAVIAQDAGAAISTDTSTTGSVGPTADTLMSAINAPAPDLSAITDTTTVNFVTVSSLQGADAAAIDAAVQGDADMASLKGSRDANAALKAKLEAAGYTSDKVLAVEQTADGSFTVYIDDRDAAGGAMSSQG